MSREQDFRDLFPKPEQPPGSGTLVITAISNTSFGDAAWEFVLPTGKSIVATQRTGLVSGWVPGQKFLLMRVARGTWLVLADVIVNPNS